MLCFIKKERRIIIFSLIVGLLVCLVNIGYTADEYTNGIQKSMASKIIRFHCIANSDSKEDQELKLKIRDAVLEYMKNRLSEVDVGAELASARNAGNQVGVGLVPTRNIEINTVRKIINDNIASIKDIAEEVVKNEGYNYSIDVRLERKVQFPLKQYGDIVLPAGEYEALRVIIGKGEGKNWWCVMFPPLCFVDEATCVVDEKTNQKIERTLTPEEYRLITNKKPVIKFKMFE